MSLDEQIFNIFKNFKNGTFIEFGANDGIQQSNTFLLEKINNWKGLLIEPSKNLFDLLKINRPNSIIECCAVSDKNGFIKGDFNGHLMSSENGNRLGTNFLVEVPCFTLNTLCDKHQINNIDLCSIDVEGYEKNIIKNIDFSKINIKNFVIEIYKWDEEEIISYLKSFNYSFKCLTNFNTNDNPHWDGTHQDYFFTLNN
jgi:FkbM family methyltransferase